MNEKLLKQLKKKDNYSVNQYERLENLAQFIRKKGFNHDSIHNITSLVTYYNYIKNRFDATRYQHYRKPFIEYMSQYYDPKKVEDYFDGKIPDEQFLDDFLKAQEAPKKEQKNIEIAESSNIQEKDNFENNENSNKLSMQNSEVQLKLQESTKAKIKFILIKKHMHLKIQRKKEVHKNNLQSIGNSLSSGKEKLGQLFDRIYDVIHRKDAYEQWQRGCIQALEEQNRELALMNQEKEVNADTENKQVKIKK